MKLKKFMEAENVREAIAYQMDIRLEFPSSDAKIHFTNDFNESVEKQERVISSKN
jgi:hypothetical protein